MSLRGGRRDGRVREGEKCNPAISPRQVKIPRLQRHQEYIKTSQSHTSRRIKPGGVSEAAEGGRGRVGEGQEGRGGGITEPLVVEEAGKGGRKERGEGDLGINLVPVVEEMNH